MRRSLRRVVCSGFLLVIGVFACSSRDNPNEYPFTGSLMSFVSYFVGFTLMKSVDCSLDESRARA